MATQLYEVPIFRSTFGGEPIAVAIFTDPGYSVDSLVGIFGLFDERDIDTDGVVTFSEKTSNFLFGTSYYDEDLLYLRLSAQMLTLANDPVEWEEVRKSEFFSTLTADISEVIADIGTGIVISGFGPITSSLAGKVVEGFVPKLLVNKGAETVLKEIIKPGFEGDPPSSSPPSPFIPDVDTVTITSVEFTGSEDAISFLTEPTILRGETVNLSLDPGILLTTGGAPGDSNTSPGFTQVNGEPGDSDLDQVAEDAFSGAGSTQDASILEIEFDVDGDNIQSISLDVVFLSEEFPEFANTSFVDVGAVFLNGRNLTLFDGDKDRPLSVTQANIDEGNFYDNDPFTDPFTEGFDIEYDGVSKKLTVFGNVKDGSNTLKIGVADTGDASLDSAIFVSNIKFLTSNGEGLFVRIDGSSAGGSIFGSTSNEFISGKSGNDIIVPGLGNDIVETGDGSDVIEGALLELDGDIITDFSNTDIIRLLGTIFDQDDLVVTLGSAILEIDENKDGVTDSTITLEGDFEGAVFNVRNVGENTEITVSFPPPNSPPSAQNDKFSLDEDQTLVGNVLADNGNGIDGDPDGDALTVLLISGLAEGSLILNDDGSFTYEADADVFDLAAPGDVIDQTFTYQIDDGNGETDQATVTISVSIQDDGETIIGTNKQDTLNGTDGGEDIIYGNNAKDMIYGLDGADTIYGGNADDMLFGGESADSLFGERGDDQLYGEQGEDYLDGGRGNDVLCGGVDNDILLGGRGDDVFVLALGEGTDTILDYGVGEDLIGLVGLTFEDLTIAQSGYDATISAHGEVLAVMIGVDALALNDADVFNFV